MCACTPDSRFNQGGAAIASGQKDRRNEAITAREVRVIDPDGEQIGILSIDDALAKAAEYELDLVEVSPNAKPPVARIMDYGKRVFERKKAKQAGKAKQKRTQLKEVKFRPGTDTGDYNIKLQKIKKFLESGDKIKVTLRFRGREMAHQELGKELLDRVRDDLEDMASVDQEPEMQGRLMTMVMSPLKGVAKSK